MITVILIVIVNQAFGKENCLCGGEEGRGGRGKEGSDLIVDRPYLGQNQNDN